jgi:hypothetical protein
MEYEEKQTLILAKLTKLSAKELVIRALRATLEAPLAAGVPPKDVAANGRLLMELTGDLGKHSKPPADPDQPAHEMTRTQLEELATKANMSAPKRKRVRPRKR